MPEAEPLAEESVIIATRWLRRRMRNEAFSKILEGFVMALGGIITTAILAAIIGLLPYALFFQRGVLRPAFSGVCLFLVCFLGVLLVSLVFGRLGERDIDYSSSRRPGGLFSILLAGEEFTSITYDFVAGGSRLLRAAGESFSAALRLLSADLAQIVPIILWLWAKRAKAHTAEIAARFPEFNTVWILPQLRDIPGIIWLPDPRGIILLSESFRNDLTRILPRPATYAEETPFTAEEEPAPGAEPADAVPEYNEAAGWYQTLGLPPYASIQQVKKKYRQLAKMYHPDTLQGRGGPRADDKMKSINVAYDNIMNSYKQRAA